MTKNITIYGIKNCQSVQKAVKLLNNKNLEFDFWDYKKSGVTTELLQKWCNHWGWQKVLNRTGMMYRKASEQDKAQVVDQESAIGFMLRVPTSIKRPIVEMEGHMLIGFVEGEYEKVF